MMASNREHRFKEYLVPGTGKKKIATLYIGSSTKRRKLKTDDPWNPGLFDEYITALLPPETTIEESFIDPGDWFERKREQWQEFSLKEYITTKIQKLMDSDQCDDD